MSQESVYLLLFDDFSHLIHTESVDVSILEDRATLWVVGGKEGAWSSDTEPLEVSTILYWSQSESNISRRRPIRWRYWLVPRLPYSGPTPHTACSVTIGKIEIENFKQKFKNKIIVIFFKIRGYTILSMSNWGLLLTAWWSRVQCVPYPPPRVIAVTHSFGAVTLRMVQPVQCTVATSGAWQHLMSHAVLGRRTFNWSSYRPPQKQNLI